MEVYSVAVAGLLGAILAGIVGFLKSTEPFNARKFLATVVTAVLIGAGLGVAYTGATVGARELLMALMTGAGTDYGRNVLSGAIVARLNRNGPPPLPRG